ncbi:PLP-dependent aminotransferase family protein [Nocardioides endophyticus]|uniref:PLP-dependent aminotransferase family protein n=1 Tax=Nocardioides endophyticus TaxID=1353775 RepID=A0ABP8YUZ1_9ACTN
MAKAIDSSAVPQPEPVYRQLYEQIRSSILAGQLPAGTRLPASRQLALENGVSRNTVLAAFEQLHAEGYIEGRHGSGTYVARTLPDRMLRATRSPAIETDHYPSSSKEARLSARGRALAEAPRMPVSDLPETVFNGTAFRIGLPALDQFPSVTWGRIHASRSRQQGRALMQYNDPAGYRPLREEIASYLAVARGIRCVPEQVIVTSGSQQALELCARILLDPDDPAWLEDPGYLGARAALISAGARIVPVPVDERGIDVSEGIAGEPAARLAVVTPSHQFPLGVTLSLDRRLKLLEWAARSDAWVIEDDYDCEFRYQGRPLAALQAIDGQRRVIYVGTFSKTMFPGLRLGYLVAPTALADAFVGAHMGTDVHRSALDQAAMADFMMGGHFLRHVRRMRTLYKERQRVLVDCVRSLRPDLVVRPAEGGLHVLGRLATGYDDQVVAQAAADRGIHAWPLSIHAMANTQPPAILLGYAGIREVDIPYGVKLLGEALRACS